MNIQMAEALSASAMDSAQWLGQTVTFLRCDKDGVVTSGSGKLQSLHIDPSGRKMALVKEEDGNAINVELMTLNYTPQVEESYRAAMADVFAISKEGNEKIKAIVDEYNAKVDDIYKMFDLS